MWKVVKERRFDGFWAIPLVPISPSIDRRKVSHDMAKFLVAHLTELHNTAEDSWSSEPLRVSGEGGAPHAFLDVGSITFSQVHGWKPTEPR